MTAIKVMVLMGSKNDRPVVAKTMAALDALGVPARLAISSAHRSPERTRRLVEEAQAAGAEVFVCAAGLAAHLAGVVAAKTLRPVIALPLSAGSLGGLDALLSSVQMPPGIPCATVGVDAGRNAGLLAAQILAIQDAGLARRLEALRTREADALEALDQD